MLVLSSLVSSFEKHEIADLIREHFGYDFPDIFADGKLDYLFSYLKKLSAKSVFIERSYVDKEYLEDFSRYYGKRFGNDGQKCVRLHFFSNMIEYINIISIIQTGDTTARNVSRLNSSYLGFLVIKPLPRAFIGKMRLQVVLGEHVDGKRIIPREYEIDFFGIPLKLLSLALQKQEKAVAIRTKAAILTWGIRR